MLCKVQLRRACQGPRLRQALITAVTHGLGPCLPSRAWMMMTWACHTPSLVPGAVSERQQLLLLHETTRRRPSQANALTRFTHALKPYSENMCGQWSTWAALRRSALQPQPYQILQEGLQDLTLYPPQGPSSPQAHQLTHQQPGSQQPTQACKPAAAKRSAALSPMAPPSKRRLRSQAASTPSQSRLLNTAGQQRSVAA